MRSAWPPRVGVRVRHYCKPGVEKERGSNFESLHDLNGISMQFRMGRGSRYPWGHNLLPAHNFRELTALESVACHSLHSTAQSYIVQRLVCIYRNFVTVSRGFEVGACNTAFGRCCRVMILESNLDGVE